MVDWFTTLVVMLDLKMELFEMMLVLMMESVALELRMVELEMMELFISPLNTVLFLMEELRTVLKLTVL